MKNKAGVIEVFLGFLRLGLTSFGGPVAHLSYFRAEFVGRSKWLDEAAYADLVALCQFLPGPASSQAGIALGYFRAGLCRRPRRLARLHPALGFGDGRLRLWRRTDGRPFPSRLAAWTEDRRGCGRGAGGPGHGAKPLPRPAPRRPCHSSRSADAGVSHAPAARSALILAGGLIGWAFLPAEADVRATVMPAPSRAAGITAAAAFVVLLFGLPLLADAASNHAVALFDAFYRAGSLVFGGGHVVLPLLRQAVVPRGWIGDDAFLAGYGAAQAVPGPLFTFAAYLGAAMRPAPNGVVGALIALFAIYLPSFLLLIATLPFWGDLRQRAGTQAALKGVNAAVVGLLLAALCTPVWTSAIFTPADFGLALAAFWMLTLWKTPPWLVVIFGALGAETFSRL